MKRALRNTETAMFIKFDGGQTESIYTARCFLSYDEAVAFCRANKLGAVELVVHSDDQSEYALAMPAKYLDPAEEHDATQEGEDEPGFHGGIMPDSEQNAVVLATAGTCEPDTGSAAQARELGAEADGYRIKGTCEECDLELPVEAEALVAAVDDSELAICTYANFEMAAHAPRFHFCPPQKCDVCGAELSGRWFFVDGRVSESGEWRDMCSHCFFIKGARIGPGKGRLYQRQSDGRWLLVGGFGG